MMRLLFTALLVCACDDGGTVVDAGRDAPGRIALTVDGPAAVATTRSLTVSVTASGSTRNDSFPVGGLPATVDLPQPIQLTSWTIQVDAFNTGGMLVGRGSASVPSGTTDAMVTLAPAP